MKRQKDKHSAKTLWLTMILVFGFVAPILIPNTVSADSLGYPWPTDAEAPCEFGSAGGVSCANPANPIYDLYDWGVYTGSTFHPYRSGYEYRNCTDYVQWKESTIGVTVPGNWNDGGLWYDNAPSTMRTTTPKAWDAAVLPGHPGHVAFVESVNSDGTITISEYNHDTQGHGDIRTGSALAMGFTQFIDFNVHPPSTSGSGRIESRAGGNLYDLTLSASYTLTGNSASAGNWKLVGDRLANMDANGLWIKDGTAGWVKVSDPVDEYQISSTRIVTRVGSNLYDVTTSGAFTLISNSASAGNWKLVGDRLANMDANGLWIKDGTGGWTKASNPVDEFQISSSRIVTRVGSNLYDVTPSGGWALLSNSASASSMKLVDNRVANMDANGLWIKDGTAGWVKVSDPVDEYQISSTRVETRVGSNLYDVTTSGSFTITSNSASAGSWKLINDRLANTDSNGLWIRDGTSNGWTKVSNPVDEFQIS